MQILKQWRVVVDLGSGQHVRLIIADNLLANVLRRLGDITFEGDVKQIAITPVPPPPANAVIQGAITIGPEGIWK